MDTEPADAETTAAEQVARFRIDSWAGVEASLGDLRATDARRRAIAARFDARIERLQTEKADAIEPLAARIGQLEAAVKDCVDRHPEFMPKGRRSRTCIHGRVGLRKTPGKLVFVTSEKNTIAALKQLGRKDCIVVIEKVSKPLVRTLAPADLDAVGARLEQKDLAYIELEA